MAAAYFCRAGRVDLLDVAQRLSDQLAGVVPGFAQARQATLAPSIHVGDVQVRTGDIAAGGSATGVRIDLGRLDAETAFVQAVTLPLRRVREAGGSTQVVLLVDALDESLASPTANSCHGCSGISRMRTWWSPPGPIAARLAGWGTVPRGWTCLPMRR